MRRPLRFPLAFREGSPPRSRFVSTACAAATLLPPGACQQQQSSKPAAAKKPDASDVSKQAAAPAPVAAFRPAQRVEHNPDRNACFGETHIHTSGSVDAWLMGNRLTGPDEAYKYAQGETIRHPKAHPIIRKDPKNQEETQKVFTYLVNILGQPPVKAFMKPEIAGSMWKDNDKIADANNQPGKFTAFCSYEFTSQNNNVNLHRNVSFRDCAKVPELPYSSLHSCHPEDLWKWMDDQRKSGNKLLAISHNANLGELDLPKRYGQLRASDRRRLGRGSRPQRAAGRDRADRGAVGDASAAVTERRVREL